MVRLEEIFDIWYGVNLELINCEETTKGDGIPFVSRTSSNNGIAGYIKEIDEIEPNPQNTLSIAGSGSVLSTFFHPYSYYSGRDVYIAKPINSLSINEMIYYCSVIEKNKYRYNYGRQANKTLKNILVPSIDEIPNSIKNYNFQDVFNKKPLLEMMPELKIEKWKWFRYNELFEISKGKRLTIFDMEDGNIPYIASGSSNNGIIAYIGNDITNQKDCITLACYGSIGEVFFHDYNIWASDNVNVIKLKNSIKLNKYLGLFIITLLNLEKYRFSYGMTAKVSRLNKFKIKLPVTPSGSPDWQFMEDYIKSLPFSANL